MPPPPPASAAAALQGTMSGTTNTIRRRSSWFEPIRRRGVQLVTTEWMTPEEKDGFAMGLVSNKLKTLETQVSEHKARAASLTQDLGKAREYSSGLERSLETTLTKLKQREQALDTVQVVHPTYGKLLAEFGNRRMFATFPERLCNPELFPTYESQRAFRSERAEAIASSIRKDDRFSGFPGMITLFEFTGEVAAETRGHQVRGIVDGQHRVGAIRLLLQSGHWPKDRAITTEVFTVKAHSDAARLFLDINKMEPVKDIDMVATRLDIAQSNEERLALEEAMLIKSTIDTVVQRLQAKYPKMFSASENCRVPNVHADTFRNALFKSSEVTLAAKRNGQKGVEEYLKMKHQEIKTRMKTSSSSISTPALEKAQTNDFYFGMIKNFEWLESS